MAAFAYEALPVVAASYVITGRFNPEKRFEKRPAPISRRKISHPRLTSQAVAMQEQRSQIVGASDEWKNYRKAFETEIEENRDSPEARDRSHFLNFLMKRELPASQ